VQLDHGLVGPGGDDGAGVDLFVSLLVLPVLPQPGEGKEAIVIFVRIIDFLNPASRLQIPGCRPYAERLFLLPGAESSANDLEMTVDDSLHF
jgi:hypothetical protein